MQHPSHYARMNAFIKQRYRGRCADKVLNRFLEFLEQARFVRGQGAELRAIQERRITDKTLRTYEFDDFDQ